LLDFNFNRKTEYPSYLEVELSFIKRQIKEVTKKKWSILPWEIETGEKYEGLKMLPQKTLMIK